MFGTRCSVVEPYYLQIFRAKKTDSRGKRKGKREEEENGGLEEHT
jgi:hypothetical protein